MEQPDNTWRLHITHYARNGERRDTRHFTWVHDLPRIAIPEPEGERLDWRMIHNMLDQGTNAVGFVEGESGVEFGNAYTAHYEGDGKIDGDIKKTYYKWRETHDPIADITAAEGTYKLLRFETRPYPLPWYKKPLYWIGAIQ